MTNIYDFVWSKWNYSYLRSRLQLYMADTKSGTWDQGLLVGPRTQDPRLPTYHIGETWVPKNGTWDQGPRPHLIVGTQHPKCGTQDPRPWKRISRKFSQVSFPWSLAIMNIFTCFMCLCLFCMFLINLSYGIYT